MNKSTDAEENSEKILLDKSFIQGILSDILKSVWFLREDFIYLSMAIGEIEDISYYWSDDIDELTKLVGNIRADYEKSCKYFELCLNQIPRLTKDEKW